MLVFQEKYKTVYILKFSTSLYIYTPTIEFYDPRVNISTIITNILNFYALFYLQIFEVLSCKSL